MVEGLCFKQCVVKGLFLSGGRIFVFEFYGSFTVFKVSFPRSKT